jgi:phospholipase C
MIFLVFPSGDRHGAFTPGRPKTISWPTDQYGYYDVVITANTADGFRRRYAGRIA